MPANHPVILTPMKRRELRPNCFVFESSVYNRLLRLYSGFNSIIMEYLMPIALD